MYLSRMAVEVCRHHSQAGTPSARAGGGEAPVPSNGQPPRLLGRDFLARSTRFLDGSPLVSIESSNRPITHANWGKGSCEIRLGSIGESRAALPARHVGLGSSGSGLRIGGRS